MALSLTPTPVAGKGIPYSWFTTLLGWINSINGNSGTLAPASYTPTWASTGGTPITVGNATVTGQFKTILGYTFFDIAFTFGSTSSAGAGNIFTWTLPSTAASLTFGSFSARIVDLGTNSWSVGGLLRTTTTVSLVRSADSGAAAADVGAGTPMTWATGDTVKISGWYAEA